MPPLNAAPQIQVKCVNVGCTEVDTPKQSPAGILLAPGVLLTGALFCLACGAPLETNDTNRVDNGLGMDVLRFADAPGQGVRP